MVTCADEDRVRLHARGHLNCAATHVIGEVVRLSSALCVQALRERYCCWLVDDTQNVHARDGARILGRLTLRTVEVRGNGHNNIVGPSPKICLRNLLHLARDMTHTSSG